MADGPVDARARIRPLYRDARRQQISAGRPFFFAFDVEIYIITHLMQSCGHVSRERDIR